jgi:hypothetical protein
VVMEPSPRRWPMIWPFLLASVGCFLVAYVRAVVFHARGDTAIFVAGTIMLIVGPAMGLRSWHGQTVRVVQRSLAIAVPLLLSGRIVSWFL